MSSSPSSRPRRSSRKRTVFVVESDDNDRPQRGKQKIDKSKRSPPTHVPLVPVWSIQDPERQKRVSVLHDTISYLKEHEQGLQQAACENLKRWAARSKQSSDGGMKVLLVADDMLETAAKLTKEHGTIFAVLNMANAIHPGGGFTTGAAAQEENMLRRTNIMKTFASPGVLKWHGEKVVYSTAMSKLINGTTGRVYCDHPMPLSASNEMHICVRGREERNQEDMGYRYLGEHQVFPFYELRSAAINIGRHCRTVPDAAKVQAEMQMRIVAQLDTLISRNIRHAVLSAFGCGAFGNDPYAIASIYARLLQRPPYNSSFDVIAFSIFFAGRGPNNAFEFFKAFQSENLRFESHSGGLPTTPDI